METPSVQSGNSFIPQETSVDYFKPQVEENFSLGFRQITKQGESQRTVRAKVPACSVCEKNGQAQIFEWP